MANSRLLAVLGLAVLCGAGCQSAPPPELGEVEGTVAGADGKPLPRVRVTFYPNTEAGTSGPESAAYTDAAGHYRLKTETGERGAVVGKHRVCLVDMEAQQDPTGGRIPRVYGSVAATPIRTVAVAAGQQTHDFKVPGNTARTPAPPGRSGPPARSGRSGPPGPQLPKDVQEKLKDAGKGRSARS